MSCLIDRATGFAFGSAALDHCLRRESPGRLRVNKIDENILVLLLLVASTLSGTHRVEAQTHYEPYRFTTLAGSAGAGYSDGIGNTARFDRPTGVAVNSAGDLYVVDAENYVIRKVTLAGVVTTFAGGSQDYGRPPDGIGTGARFYFPQKAALDQAGNVYVANMFGETIRKITPAGVVTTFAGSGEFGSADGVGTAAQFGFPSGVAVDNAGTIYVAEYLNNTIRKITPAGVVSAFAGLAGSSGSADGPGSAARFYAPEGLAVDGAGNLYVADTSNNTIRKITSAGIVSTFAGLAGYFGYADGNGSDARFSWPYDIAADNNGNLYVADSLNDTIRKITPAGIVSTLAGSAGMSGSGDGTGNAARFAFPNGVAPDNSGNLYVADSANNLIRKITSAGVVSTIAGAVGRAGAADGPGGAAHFNAPFGVTLDNARNLYVADSNNHTIRKVTPAGVTSTFAGLAGTYGSNDGLASDARFYYPTDVATDSTGNLYVADSANDTIRKIGSDGVVSTFAGVAGGTGSADGPRTVARFNNPRGVAVDTFGVVYVSDSANSTVRKITPEGIVSTLAGLAGSAGTADGTGSAARFFNPWSLRVDSAGNIYVAEIYKNTIRKITPGGVVTTFVGLAGASGSADGAGNAVRFRNPAFVAVDSAGYIYVTDNFNNTIRKITPAGSATTLAGSADDFRVGSIDGIGGVVRFARPTGIAVDNTGNIYVADYENNTIRAGAPPVQLVSAVSSKVHGNAGTFDIDLPPTGDPAIECRSGGATNDYTIVFDFMNNVSVGSATVAAGAGVGNVNNFNVAGNHATVNLTGVSDVQPIVVTLTGVNDGTKTGYTSIPMRILVGDTTNNGIVNSSDVSQIKALNGTIATAMTFHLDITANGLINSSDISLAKSRSGGALTPPDTSNVANARGF